jgi:hypothetical protein
MSEIDETTGTEPATKPGGVDRRAALKKVAIGGAVAWTAPTLLSSTASAQVPFCTPKCEPTPAIFVNIVAALYCNTNGAKWVQIRFGLNGVTCPCGGSGDPVLVLATVSGGNATVKPESTFGTIIIGGPGNGALGNGSYDGSIRFQTSCVDRDGDTIVRFCTYTYSFTFSPGDGPCSQGTNVGAVTPGTLTCDAPICNP